MVSVPWQSPEGQASVCQALQQHVINTSCPKKIIIQFNYLCYCIVASFNIFRKEEVFFIIKLNLCFKSSHCFSHTPLSLPRKKGVHGGKWNKKKNPKYASASSKLSKFIVNHWGRDEFTLPTVRI